MPKPAKKEKVENHKKCPLNKDELEQVKSLMNLMSSSHENADKKLREIADICMGKDCGKS